MGIILPIASGKGGVGKSAIAANLSASLASLGLSITIVDLDLGAANMHTLLGVKDRGAGLGGFINKTTNDFTTLVKPTSIENLSFIPGDLFLPGTANLNYFTKLKIIKALKNHPSDITILDLGAGTSFNTIDFFCLNNEGIVVTIPETTAILNAYSFLKFTLFRLISRQFPAKGGERKVITSFLSNKIEGTDKSFTSLKDALSPFGDDAIEIIDKTLASFTPKIIINRGKTSGDIKVGQNLRSIIMRNLDINVEFIGLIPESKELVPSIFKGIPATILYPQSKYSQAISRLARKIALSPTDQTSYHFYDDEDLTQIQTAFDSLTNV